MTAMPRENLPMALLYNAGQILLSPALAAYLGYRLLIQGKSRAGFGQRLGNSPDLGPPPEAGRVWLQAVSAGEVAAAAPIIRHLRAQDRPPRVVLSTTTPAGQDQARGLDLDLEACFYFPFDFWPCVVRSLDRIQPTVIASVETEIWPNWLLAATRRGLPTALVNGRFSDRGFQRARRFRALYRWPLQKLDALLMQTDADAERATVLGAPEDRLRVVGSSKFEQSIVPLTPVEVQQLRAEFALPDGSPVLVAGSTHPGEEEIVLDTFTALRRDLPGLELILAPRHLTRADEVARLIEARGYHCLRRTGKLPPTPPSHSVRLLDTMGELARVYGLATVAFVGGSLVPIGGHDVLQPLFHGVPVVFGPHMRNQRELAALTIDAGAAIQVKDESGLRASLALCLQDDSRRVAMREAAASLIERHRGAARAAAELLGRLAGTETLT